MNKKEAASYLGVSTRAIERYTQQGKISVKYEKGKTRPVAVYEQQELDRLKEELNATVHKPAVEISTKTDNLDLAGVGVSGLVEKLVIPLSQQLKQLTEAVQNLERRRTPIVPVEEKLLLTLKEVQALTGLSREILREAIAAKKLKAKIVGKAWRIKRGDLEDYIEQL